VVLRGTTRITRKGQITIPAAIREALGTAEGDRVAVSYDEETQLVTLVAAGSVVRRTAGMLKRPGRQAIDPQQEKRSSREAWSHAAAERDARSKCG
jgi:AbrB family looped-hinge helix DNA binding protein